MPDDDAGSPAELVHDLRNMLAVIEVAASSLEQCIGARGVSERDVSDMRQATSRARELAQRLAFMEAAPPPAFAIIDLNDVIRSMQNVLSRLAGAEVDLQLDLCSRPAWVRGDALQLEQVLGNLVRNAGEAMPQGGLLTITTTEIELSDRTADVLGLTKGRHVRWVVRDRGPGVPRSQRARIWHRGFTTRSGEVRGLGLPSVRQAIERHGGAVDLVSTRGEGATFRIHLPCASAPSTSKPNGVSCG